MTKRLRPLSDQEMREKAKLPRSERRKIRSNYGRILPAANTPYNSKLETFAEYQERTKAPKEFMDDFIL